MVYERNYYPDELIYPGMTLSDLLNSIWMSQKELSVRMDMSEKQISGIIQWKFSITPETALKLERVLWVDAEFWSNLERAYQEDKVRMKEEKLLEIEQEEVTKFTCYSKLVELWFVKKVRKKTEKLKELLSFFGVTSIFSISKVSNIVYRKTESKNLDINQENLLAWLRCGELKARDIEVDEFSRLKFRQIIPELKKLTKKDYIDLDKIKQLLSSAGVIFVYIPYFTKVPVNGVSKKINGKPLIQISDRWKKLDIFWFSLFHEIAHVLNHLSKKDDLFLNFEFKSDGKDIEEEANIWAGETLINTEIYTKIQRGRSIVQIAREAWVWVHIVAGRVGYDTWAWSDMAEYRKRICFL